MKKYIFPFLIIASLTSCDLSSPVSTVPNSDEVSAPTSDKPKIISFTATKSEINSGESVTLSWETEGASKILLNPFIESVAAKGTKELTPLSSTVYSLMAFGSEESKPVPHAKKDITIYIIKQNTAPAPNEATDNQTDQPATNVSDNLNSDDEDSPITLIPIQVMQPKKQKPSNIDSLSLGLENSLWAGATNGDLIKYDPAKNKWSKIAGARVGIHTADQTITDDTPITSILEMADGCEGDIYFGTQGGFLYRSHDGGKTLTGLKGGEYAVQFFTSDAAHPFDNPSPINFVASDPDNPKAIYVGHSAGLVHFSDCENPAADNADYLFPHKNVLAATEADDAFLVLIDGEIQQIDSLQNWEILDTGNQPINWIGSGLDHLFYGTGQNVSKYVDPNNQIIWKHEGTDLAESENIIFTGSPDGLYFKRKNASKWITVSGIDAPVKKLLLTNGNDILWVLTTEGDVYKLEGLL